MNSEIVKIIIYFSSGNKLKIRIPTEAARDLVNKCQNNSFEVCSAFEDINLAINWKKVDYLQRIG